MLTRGAIRRRIGLAGLTLAVGVYVAVCHPVIAKAMFGDCVLLRSAPDDRIFADAQPIPGARCFRSHLATAQIPFESLILVLPNANEENRASALVVDLHDPGLMEPNSATRHFARYGDFLLQDISGTYLVTFGTEKGGPNVAVSLGAHSARFRMPIDEQVPSALWGKLIETRAGTAD